jgi:hypothetical protein
MKRTLPRRVDSDFARMRSEGRRLGRLARATIALSALLFVSALVARPALAEENDALFEYGGLSCDEWISHSDLSAAETPKWLMGYLAQQVESGGYRVDVMKQIKSDQIMPWIDNYCRARPLDGLAVAGTALINELALRAAPGK